MESCSSKYKSFRYIVNMFYNQEIEDTGKNIEKSDDIIKNVNIKPRIINDSINKNKYLEVFIGKDTMYKVKKLSKFYDAITYKEKCKYGDKLEFIHTKEAFCEECLPLLEFILKYSEMIKYANNNIKYNYKHGVNTISESKIVLDESAIDNIFDILKNQIVEFEKDGEIKKIKFEISNPQIMFYLRKDSEDEYILLPNINIFKVNIINGKDYNYLLINTTLYRCDKKFENTTMKLLNAMIQNYLPNIKFGINQLPQFFSIIMPKIQNNIKIEVNKEEIKKYMPKSLKSKLYLDFDNNSYLIADLRFIYDETEYNPLGEKIKKEKLRNIIKEAEYLNFLRKTGFMLDTKNLRFVLTDNDKIYDFVTDDINQYIEKFEILATDNYKSKKIIKPKISNLGIKIENNLLQLDLKSLNIDINEIISIIEKYRLKKKYYRLKDGTFLKLDDNKDIDFLNKLVTGTGLEYNELSTGIIRMPINRSLYLNQLLEQLNDVYIEKDSKYNEIIYKLNKNNMEICNIPNELNNILRQYQKIGFMWLKELDNYRFGGILADDMGLGKTIQILTLIEDYIENEQEKRKASIVVSPSSLALNWENEANKFVPNLKVLVISGATYERKRKIQSIDDYDLVITSYDLLKRDVEYYIEKNYHFKYVIADEAQYLKNSNTQNAMTIKLFQADTRYALTGTPMENSLAELWSIFDFIMPGYLFTYRQFKNSYEIPIVKDKDENVMKKLKMLIEPFVLRRTKQEVLTELPEKTVTVLRSSMNEEQEKIYLSYLAQAKQEIQDSIEMNGIQKSNMKILALLTRLRQICCHPSAFIENYEGGSSKLEQCIELIKNGVESGHKILLFSSYTSVLSIIENELLKNDISFLMLTGATKVDERLELVNRFNNDEEIKVFLISLKAGGTGLNLTGADMVIHFDPWWNASAENQATDRAYRIGQKNNVQVYKLITKDSIEEKMYELQNNKSALIDNVLDINASFVSKLSRDEILELFE